MSADPIGRAPVGGDADAPDPRDRADLAAEIANAGRGLVELVAARPAWARNFDLSSGGFLRSFLGPTLALPLHVFGFALVERVALAGKAIPAIDFSWVALAHVIDMLAFPLLIALIAKPLRIGGGYTAFIVVMNWAALFVNLVFAASALLALAGSDGVELFRFIYLILLCGSVFLVWRSGRMTLSHDLAPVLLVVVLSVAVSAFADQVAGWIVSVV